MPFDLHRYIIGQKGSGIRRMMDEFEVTRPHRPFPWRPGWGGSCWGRPQPLPEPRPPSSCGAGTWHPACSEPAGVSLAKCDRQATGRDFQTHPRGQIGTFAS